MRVVPFCLLLCIVVHEISSILYDQDAVVDFMRTIGGSMYASFFLISFYTLGFAGGKRSVVAPILAERSYLDAAQQAEEQTDCIPQAFCLLATQKNISEKTDLHKVVQAISEQVSQWPEEKLDPFTHPGDRILLGAVLGDVVGDTSLCQKKFPNCGQERVYQIIYVMDSMFKQLLNPEQEDLS